MGNPGKRPMKTAPARVAGSPDMPSTLKGDARKCWEWVVDLLARRGQLTLDSRPSLVALCEVFAEREALRRYIEKRGRFQKVVTTAGDKVDKLHPAVPAFQDADRRYRGWLVEFGLTDASRGKVQVDPTRAPGARGQQPLPVRGDEADPATRYGLQ